MALELFQNLVAHFLHDDGPWIVSLIDPVAKTHESERIISVPCSRYERIHITPAGLNVAQHLHHSLVGSPVQGTPECRYASRNGGIEIYPRTSHQSDSCGGAVLLVIRMEDPEYI